MGNFFIPAGFPQQLLIVSGSAYTLKDGGALLQLEVLVGGTIHCTPATYSNESSSHKAFPTALIPLALAPGATHTLTIREKDGTPTSTGPEDYFSACLVLGP